MTGTEARTGGIIGGGTVGASVPALTVAMRYCPGDEVGAMNTEVLAWEGTSGRSGGPSPASAVIEDTEATRPCGVLLWCTPPEAARPCGVLLWAVSDWAC